MSKKASTIVASIAKPLRENVSTHSNMLGLTHSAFDLSEPLYNFSMHMSTEAF
jgi:hypothetical protein